MGLWKKTMYSTPIKSGFLKYIGNGTKIKIGSKSGVTLIETLIVIIIVGILVAVSVPILQNLVIRSHLAQIDTDLGTAMQVFRTYIFSHYTFPKVGDHIQADPVTFAQLTGIDGLPENRPDMHYYYCAQGNYCCYHVETLVGGEYVLLLDVGIGADGTCDATVNKSHPWGQLLYDILRAKHQYTYVIFGD